MCLWLLRARATHLSGGTGYPLQPLINSRLAIAVECSGEEVQRQSLVMWKTRSWKWNESREEEREEGEGGERRGTGEGGDRGDSTVEKEQNRLEIGKGVREGDGGKILWRSQSCGKWNHITTYVLHTNAHKAISVGGTNVIDRATYTSSITAVTSDVRGCISQWSCLVLLWRCLSG